LLVCKALIRNAALYRAPEGKAPPPWWIRGILVLTCTGVSFAHGSNDGQKGMGLIMLILIGTVPTAYALNRAMGSEGVAAFQAATQNAVHAVRRYAEAGATASADPRREVTAYVRDRTLLPGTLPAFQSLATGVANDVARYGALSRVPTEKVSNVRNDMY